MNSVLAELREQNLAADIGFVNCLPEQRLTK